MKTYIEFINEEIGESMVEPYDYQKSFEDDEDVTSFYHFETEDGDKYLVRFFDLYKIHKKESYKDYYQVEFVVNGDYGYKVVMNKGRFYRVMSTVISIIKDFIDEKDPRKLKINPSTNYKKDKRRKNIYIRYIEKLLPDTYKYKKTWFGNTLIISKKD